MSYVVMYRGHMRLRTNDLAQARAKMEEIGDTSYIQYGQKGREDYENRHPERHMGEQE